jgi:predicted HNH restriction endonuclease
LDNDSIERNEFWHSTAKISFQKLYMENYSKGGVAYWYGMYFDPGQGDDQWIAQSSKIRSFIEKQSLFILDVLLKDDMDKIDETIEGELVDVGGGLARSRKSNLYRTIVIVRAQGRCQACKWYAKIGDQYILDIHHLIPIKKGEQRVTLDKLVALCPTCHRIAHSRPEPLKLAEIMRKAKRRN